jgi:hypothetical protein
MADREFKLVRYEISNADTPQFLTPGNEPVAPNSEIVQNMKPNTPVLRLTGTISKNGKVLTVKNLVISAGKYRRPDTSILPNSDSNTISVIVAEFKKGRGNRERKVDASAKSVSSLLSFFGTPQTNTATSPKTK